MIRNVLAGFESEGPACEVVEKSRALQVERMPPHLSRIFDIIANEISTVFQSIRRSALVTSHREAECDT
jgi:hypothetical protein